jgi:hypothetical protein
MKTLYHYTCIELWPLIAESGRLNTTESNLSMHREHAGPDVVWLTTDSDCQHDHGLTRGDETPAPDITWQHGVYTDKTRVRITVELPNREVHKWCEWAIKRGIDPKWLQGITTGGAGTWRVVEKPIPMARWVEVIDREDATILWKADGS